MLRFLVLLRAMRRDIALLLYAMLQRDTPRAVKVLFPLSLLYLISPIDIIPDTIPLFGAVDDMVILPAATSLLIRMLPAHTRMEGERRVERYGTWLLVGASVLMLLWIVIFVWALVKVFSLGSILGRSRASAARLPHVFLRRTAKAPDGLRRAAAW